MQWLSRILSDAWKFYWRELPSIAVVLLLIWLPIELFASYLNYFVYGEEGAAKVDRYYRVLGLFVGVISDGAIISIVIASLLGRSTSPHNAIAISLRAWGRLFIGRAVAGFVILGGLLLVFLPGLYCFVKLSILDQIVINEKQAPMRNVKRSFELTRGKVPQLFALNIIYVLLGALAYFSALAAVSAFSITENWVTEAFLSLAYDFMEALGIVCMTYAYADLAGHDMLNAELFGPILSDRSIFDDQRNLQEAQDDQDNKPDR